MGWTYPHGATLKSIMAECSKGWERPTHVLIIKTTCLARCFRGNINYKGTLWVVFETTWTLPLGLEAKPAQRWIACFLLECRSFHGVRSWGYKDMDESCEPYYYNCPEKYLTMVPEVACEDWREGVRQYHVERRRKQAVKKARKEALLVLA